MAKITSLDVDIYGGTTHDHTFSPTSSIHIVYNIHEAQYIELVKYALSQGVRKPNRTGVDTISVFGYQMRFDLRDGTIPMLTTKKMFTRGIIREILWYLQGTGDTQYLKEHRVTIWDEWKNGKQQLGPVYGAMWRAYPSPYQFSPQPIRRIVDQTTSRVWNNETNTIELIQGKYCGRSYLNKDGLKYTVLGVDGKGPNGNGNDVVTYAVQFQSSGWIKYGISTSHVTRGRFVDQSYPTVYGVGRLGNYQNKKETSSHKHLRRVWELMISRCYNVNDIAYETHGKQGVRVCNRWLVLSDFINDAQHLPNWFVKRTKQNYVLDKDYFGSSNLYHPLSCSWITREENNWYRCDAIPVQLTSSQDVLFFPTESSAAKFLGVGISAIKSRRLGKVSGKCNGFEVAAFSSDAFVIRRPHTIDQIALLVHKLKNNPNDRRMLVSGWNPGALPYDSITPADNASLGFQALPPCHYSFQCYARPLTSEQRMKLACKRYHINEILDNTTEQTVDGWMDEAEIPKYELSMLLNQRSCDIGLGVPFNIVQYSILLRMLAEVANMTPGDFIWNGGDVHVYENHVDALKEQLTREAKPAPKFRFARKITDIDDFKFEDFIIEGYECHPTIKMDVAV